MDLGNKIKVDLSSRSFLALVATVTCGVMCFLLTADRKGSVQQTHREERGTRTDWRDITDKFRGKLHTPSVLAVAR